MRNKNRHMHLMAAQAMGLALVLAAAPAAAAHAEEAGKQYVISDENEDPSLRHGDDCMRDYVLEGGGTIQATPGSEYWDAAGGHHDGLCYKVDKDASAGWSEGGTGFDEDGGTGAGDEYEHGKHCWQKGYVCDDTDPGHEHDASCIGAGYVDDHVLMEHDGTCQHNRKPSTMAPMFLDSLLRPGSTGTGTPAHGGADAGDGAIAPIGDPGSASSGDKHMELPATGGEGSGMLLSAGIFGSLFGAAVLMALRRRA